MTRSFLVTLTIDFEFDLGCRSPYSKYVCDTPCGILMKLGGIVRSAAGSENHHCLL